MKKVETLENNNTPSKEQLSRLSHALKAGFVPALLSPQYRENYSEFNPEYGFCSVASEVAWFLLGGKDAGWTAYNVRDGEQTHWWLQHSSGLRYDPTERQYRNVGEVPPYERGLTGRPGGFMGIRKDPDSRWEGERKPSARAQQMMDVLGIEPGKNWEAWIGVEKGTEKVYQAPKSSPSPRI